MFFKTGSVLQDCKVLRTLVSLATFLLSLKTPDCGSCDSQAAGTISEVGVSRLVSHFPHYCDQMPDKSNVRRAVYSGPQSADAVYPV